MTTDEAKRIAEGLSAYRRRAILSAHEVPLHVSDLNGSSALFIALMKCGLVDRKRCRPKWGVSFWGYFLTPLGLAVRAELLKERDDVPQKA